MKKLSNYAENATIALIIVVGIGVVVGIPLVTVLGAIGKMPWDRALGWIALGVFAVLLVIAFIFLAVALNIPDDSPRTRPDLSGMIVFTTLAAAFFLGSCWALGAVDRTAPATVPLTVPRLGWSLAALPGIDSRDIPPPDCFTVGVWKSGLDAANARFTTSTAPVLERLAADPGSFTDADLTQLVQAGADLDADLRTLNTPPVAHDLLAAHLALAASWVTYYQAVIDLDRATITGIHATFDDTAGVEAATTDLSRTCD